MGGDAKCGLAAQVTFSVALITGTSNSILSKILLSVQSVGITGQTESFVKPLFQTTWMFFGMVVALIVHFIHRGVTKARGGRKGYQAVSESPGPSVGIKHLLMLAMPASFDLVATGLSMMGLVFVEVSVSQMLRGAAIVFVAFLKQTVLKHKLKPYMQVASFF